MARSVYRLRPVGMDFLDTAPVRLVFSAAVAAPQRLVYHALADEIRSWPKWFKAVKEVTPAQEGHRVVVLLGGARFEETVLAADRPSRYAYRADTVNRPGLRAVLEEWRVAPIAESSFVQWTIAVDPGRGTRSALRLMAPVLWQ